MRYALCLLFLLLGCASECQWAAGLKVVGLLHRPAGNMIYAGGGAALAYRTSERSWLLGEVEGFIPRMDRYQYETGPRNLPTGDTASALHDVRRSTSCVAARVGTVLSLGHDRGYTLAGKAMIGHALDRTASKITSTYYFTGERHQDEHVTLRHSVELAIGPSLLVLLKKRTLMVDLVGTLAYGSINDQSGSAPGFELRAAMLSVGYWWGRGWHN